MKPSRICSSVIILSCFAQGVAWAQPTIGSVTGTISHGALITINGTQLNAETKLNWDNFFISHPNAWSFEGSSPSADGFSAEGPSGGVYDSAVKLIGSKSVRFHAQGPSSNCPSGNLGDYNSFTFADRTVHDVWFRVYVRWDEKEGGWSRNYIKMLYTTVHPGFYLQPTGNPDGNLPTDFLAKYGPSTAFGTIPSGQLQNNRWYAVEWRIKNSSPTAVQAWIDGQQIVNVSNAETGNPIDHLLFGLVNLCETSSSFNLDHWMDGLAVSKSRVFPSALVEVGDSPNYASARKNVQAVEKISDSQIVFRLNNTNLGPGPYYVWVRNNAQALTAAFPLGQTSPPPAAPTTLRIVP